jgi:flagellar P-ring protein precursor FlgI
MLVTRFLRALALVLLLGVSFTPATAQADRLRELCDVVGVRENQLIGYGIVTGLQGTGDNITAPFANQSLIAFLRRMGVQFDSEQVQLRNVAAVLVTATIPAFARQGGRIDVTVSSMGNAKSLQGGVLLQTPLAGADRQVYAVAQGPLVVGGYEAGGKSGSSVKVNITTTGRVPAGALVEREITTNFVNDGHLTLALREADFTTASRIATALDKAFGAGTAHPLDGGAVRVAVPETMKERPVDMLARLVDIDVTPSAAARVVINERTGTIVAGGDVRLSPVAISHGSLSIVVKETPVVSQPGAFATGGDTKIVERTDIQAQEGSNPDAPPPMAYISGAATLADVAKALTSLGVTPRELASILQALRGAGALRADVIVQ